MIPEEWVVCSGLGVVKEEKQRLVETRPSILASVTDQEHVGGGAWGGEGWDWSHSPTFCLCVACLLALICCEVHSHAE